LSYGGAGPAEQGFAAYCLQPTLRCYITNPREERKLINPAYQQALAHAMIDGIRTYFKQNALRTFFSSALAALARRSAIGKP
jgi:hypothetical protein